MFIKLGDFMIMPPNPWKSLPVAGAQVEAPVAAEASSSCPISTSED